jgi:hypothetical protein
VAQLTKRRLTKRRDEAVLLAAEIVDCLRRLDPPNDWTPTNGGWTASSRDRWLPYFEALERRLKAGDQELAAQADHLIRALDNDSVVGGDVREKAAKLQRKLARLVKR